MKCFMNTVPIGKSHSLFSENAILSRGVDDPIVRDREPALGGSVRPEVVDVVRDQITSSLSVRGW
jgi:hypothetical protein